MITNLSSTRVGFATMERIQARVSVTIVLRHATKNAFVEKQNSRVDVENISILLGLSLSTATNAPLRHCNP
jgi:hypothetical protein